MTTDWWLLLTVMTQDQTGELSANNDLGRWMNSIRTLYGDKGEANLTLYLSEGNESFVMHDRTVVCFLGTMFTIVDGSRDIRVVFVIEKKWCHTMQCKDMMKKCDLYVAT